VTGAFFERDSLFDAACDHFKVTPQAVSMFRKPNKKEARKRQQIAETLDGFRNVMSSSNPPRTKQEAVEMVAPFLTVVLSFFFRQFAIEVIEWLWDQMQESQDSER
jgi:hypothetical protein